MMILSSRFLLVAVVLASVAFGGCPVMMNQIFTGEPAAATDATPPPGYSPIYVNRILPVPPSPSDLRKPAFSLTRVEANQPNKVRVYLHLLDSTGAYLTGGLAGKWKSVWCGFEDEFDGKVRPITKYTLREATEQDRDPHAVALVMDNSGSMGETRALAAQNGAEQFIRQKRSEDGIALVRYDHHTVVESPVATDQGELLGNLKKNGLEGFGGGTAIANGIAAGIEQVMAAQGFRRRAIVVFTDGQDNSSTIDKDSVVALAKRNNITICAVDFGEGVNGAYLQDIALRTGGSYYQIYRTSEFQNVFEDIYRRLRNYYIVEYDPQDYGVHTIRLKLCLGKDSLTAQAAFDNTPDIGTIALLHVNFDFDKAAIKSTSMPAIDNMYALMRTYPRLTIELRGHTDSRNSTGDPNYNVKLSQRRADAVKEALVKRGIAPDRITAIGFGERQPIADNGTDEGRAQNRRTEFVILSR
ncbi:MAG: OmpA family protein [Candidatus Kapabacteria bacterium]|nr:OmpA family protein [Candidatus Kapabacteria bacterium]